MSIGWTTNDLEPPLTGTVLDDKTPVDLTPASSVIAHIRRADSTVFTHPAVRGNQLLDPGSFSMAWQIGDLYIEGGYTVEIEVLWGLERPQTFGPYKFPVAKEIA